MSKPYEIHVISNTHWDREWLYDFQETRMMLVEFFDRLLEVLEHEPGYHSYLLDAQTVPIEDYLEARPEMRDTIARLVSAGRIWVGPWYTCPEAFCVNGESLVRNLLYGHRVAGEFGQVMKVGHTPFSYGQNSQMPQIYAGFGVDTILFYHGVSHDDTPNEFIFEGADGTRVFGSQMSSGARYNFYHNVYRRMLYDARIDDREYAWAQDGLPFHRCSEAHCMEHHFQLDPILGWHVERLEECVLALREAEIHTETTRHLAFMDGHDSSVADAATLRMIDAARGYLGADVIFHSSLPALMEKVKKAARDLPVLRGERRVPKPMGARVHLYSDVLSCRTRMKRFNAQAEVALQRWAEPFAALATLLPSRKKPGYGVLASYPAALLDLAWKTLLRCHPHDSIAGTGVDDIERDMNDRLRQVINIAHGLTTRGMQEIQLRIDNADAGGNDVVLTVFNPSPYPRSEIVTAVLDLPTDCGYGEFSLVDASSRKTVAFQMVSRKPFHAVVNHALDATAMMTCDRATIRFEAREVPGLGYATYRLERGAASEAAAPKGIVCGHNAMSNEHLDVVIRADGSLAVTDKATGARFDGLHYFEDGGEAGHAWMHIEPAQDSIVTSLGQPARVSLEENGPLRACYKIEYRMAVPVGLDENGGDAWQRLDGGANSSRRTEETLELAITSYVALEKGAKAVDVATRFENPCKNHRLRVMFPARIPAKTCSVESAFDVVEREIVHGPDSPWATAINPTFPMQRFVDVSDGKTGVAIINDGLREYEVSADADRTIAITLLRAFEVALTTVSKRWERHPEMGLSQSPGLNEFRYRIYPHAGSWDKAEVLREAERLALQLEPAQAGAHAGDLPKRCGFLEIEPANLVLAALKRSEDGGGIVVRVFNPTSRRLNGAITLRQKIASASEVTLEEKPIRKLPVTGKSLRFTAGAKKIVTLRIHDR